MNTTTKSWVFVGALACGLNTSIFADELSNRTIDSLRMMAFTEHQDLAVEATIELARRTVREGKIVDWSIVNSMTDSLHSPDAKTRIRAGEYFYLLFIEVEDREAVHSIETRLSEAKDVEKDARVQDMLRNALAESHQEHAYKLPREERKHHLFADFLKRISCAMTMI